MGHGPRPVHQRPSSWWRPDIAGRAGIIGGWQRGSWSSRDDDRIRKALRLALGHEQDQVVEAGSAEEALSIPTACPSPGMGDWWSADR